MYGLVDFWTVTQERLTEQTKRRRAEGRMDALMDGNLKKRMDSCMKGPDDGFTPGQTDTRIHEPEGSMEGRKCRGKSSDLIQSTLNRN